MGDTELAFELKRRGIRDERVLTAIASLKRADFVPPVLASEATADRPLPIGYQQTISQPYVVAFMSEALGLKGGERVLEIGTGSGYQTAVLARLGAEVYSIEIVPELARQARERLANLTSSGRIYLREGDGNFGWADAAPFDAILLTAAPVRLPPALLSQLAPGGTLVAPVGDHEDAQKLIRIRKDAAGRLDVEPLLPVQFVPMTGGASRTWLS